MVGKRAHVAHCSMLPKLLFGYTSSGSVLFLWLLSISDAEEVLAVSETAVHA